MIGGRTNRKNIGIFNTEHSGWDLGVKNQENTFPRR